MLRRSLDSHTLSFMLAAKNKSTGQVMIVKEGVGVEVRSMELEKSHPCLARFSTRFSAPFPPLIIISGPFAG